MANNDKYYGNLTLKQLRQLRTDQTKNVNANAPFAKKHAKYVKNAIKSIESGSGTTRFTSKHIKELSNKASAALGITADDVLKLTLSKTQSQTAEKLLDLTSLQIFSDNVKLLQARYGGGITVKGVINNSLDVDIKRGNQQIHFAQILKKHGNVFYYVTNASKMSKHTNHIVMVQFNGYDSLTIGRSGQPPVEDVKEMIDNGTISFDCTCEHHMYRYRYIATMGGYAYGIKQDMPPLKTNKFLKGVACKHVLRVMKQIQSTRNVQEMQAYAKKDIQDSVNAGKSVRSTKSGIRKQSENELKKMNDWKSKLHNSRLIRKEIAKAQKKISKINAAQRKKDPSKATKNETATYTYAKQTIKKRRMNKKDKEVFQLVIDAYDNKWKGK